MLTVELQVPCDDVVSLGSVVDHEYLHEVFDSSRVDVLDPHFLAKVDVEIDWFGVVFSDLSAVTALNRDVLQLAAAFDDDVVLEDPY